MTLTSIVDPIFALFWRNTELNDTSLKIFGYVNNLKWEFLMFLFLGFNFLTSMETVKMVILGVSLRHFVAFNKVLSGSKIIVKNGG
jgi:hypothetical protein